MDYDKLAARLDELDRRHAKLYVGITADNEDFRQWGFWSANEWRAIGPEIRKVMAVLKAASRWRDIYCAFGPDTMIAADSRLELRNAVNAYEESPNAG